MACSKYMVHYGGRVIIREGGPSCASYGLDFLRFVCDFVDRIVLAYAGDGRYIFRAPTRTQPVGQRVGCAAGRSLLSLSTHATDSRRAHAARVATSLSAFGGSYSH